ncbi:MAG: proprotein convertase P-domain-containing protein [Saprospiraceae bacterium]|nr:proprotein convertase P-domain-containing protein [Saprospiraceae bacterium]
MNLKATLIFSSLLTVVSSVVAQQNYLMTSSLTSVTSCDGFFMDSGGGNNNYGANQHYTTTICPSGGPNSGNHIQLVFNAINLFLGDDLCFFDGQNGSAPAIACASDFNPGASFIIQASASNTSGCITVKFDSDFIFNDDGWSADINCIPACQTILSVLDASTPTVEPVDTGWIDVCPGDRVFFNGKGSYPQNGVSYNQSDNTSNFEWDFGDGTITYGPSVSHIFEEPGGYIVQLEITDQLGCKNTNFLSQRIRVAPRPKFEIGAVPSQICVGDTIELNAMVNNMDPAHSVSVQPVEGSFQTAGIRSDSLALPDGDGSCYETAISFNNVSPGQTLTNINDLLGIYVTMEHSWMRDLEITLTCPNGQKAILHNHAGQTGGEVFLGIPNGNDEGLLNPIPGTGFEYGWSPSPDYNQTWIQYANTHVIGTLPAGTYKSFDPLTNFIGCPLNGDWEIEVCDLWSIDNGYIFSWSIEFDPALYPDVEKFTPQITNWSWAAHPSIFSSEADSINVSPLNAGELAYIFTVQDTFGCSWDTTVQVAVLPPNHPNCSNCSDLLAPAPDTTVCMGETIAMNVTGPVQANPAITFESDDNYPIGASNHPNGNPYNSVLAINSMTPANITNATTDIVSVCIDISTDYDADLNIYLVSPTNQVLMLSTNNGGSGDNYTKTCFTPTAITPITSGTAPFTGNFRPEGNWTVLNGAPINGNWTLRVSDNVGLNAMGRVNSWTITFKSQNNLTYTWTPTVGLSCSHCPTPVITPTNNTSYIVTASNSLGCVQKDTIAVNVLSSFAAPIVDLQVQGIGQVLATWNDANPGLSYEVNVNNTGWVTPNTSNLSHLITGLSNGSVVNVEVRAKVNGASCNVGVGLDNLVYQFCPIDAFPTTAGPYAVGCNGVCNEAIQISVVNGIAPFDYTINNLTTGSTASQNNGNITGLCPGVYQIIVEDGGMCLDTVNLTVNDIPPIIVSVIQTEPVNCPGGSDGCASVTATGGVGGFTYLWNNANMSTTPLVCGLPIGPISVTATDLNGCTATGAISITAIPTMVLTITKTDVKCKGAADGTASVVVNGGQNPYTYQWSAGTTPTQTSTNGLNVGSVSVTVTDANGCQQFGNIVINEPQNALEVDAIQTTISCYSENESAVNATATGGTGPYTYSWAPGGQTTPNLSNISIGQYTVTAKDANGCTATDMVDVVQWPAYDINIATTPPSCSGSTDGRMNVVVIAGGNGTYSYSWSTGATTDLLTNLQGGITYTVTVTDGQGCTGTASRLLEDPITMSIPVSAIEPKCNAGNDGSASVGNIVGGLSPYSFAWDASAMSQTTQTATDLQAGTYSVVVTDAAGCTSSATVSVGEPAALAVDFKSVNNSCFGYEDGVAEAEVQGGISPYTFVWSNGGTSAKQVELAADSYYLTITDGNGCSKIDSVFISAPDPVDAEVVVKNVSCNGGRDGAVTITPIGGTPPFTFSTDGEQYYGSSTLIALKADDYVVYMKDVNGCIFDLPATVEEPPVFTVDIQIFDQPLDEFIVEYGTRVPLYAKVENAQGDVMFSWDAGYCGTLFQDTMSDCTATLVWSALWALPDYSNDYYVVAIDSNGCEAEDHIQLHVRKTRRVVVPTGFSPNDSGTNDRLVVHGKSGTMIKRFQVFDRWGELLYEELDIPINDTSKGWDGTFKSKDMPPGVYVWFLEAEYEDGMTETFKGETTLIR